MNRIAVVGAGAWGTALALHAVRVGGHVTLVTRNAATAQTIRTARENRRLPDVPLPKTLHVMSEVPRPVDLILYVVPTQAIRTTISMLPRNDIPLVMCAKGVEIGTNKLPLEIVEEVAPGRPLAILTGPNFAHEVAKGLPAAAVIASRDEGLRNHVRGLIGSTAFRLYGNDDPIGAQVGGAAKNVIAIAAGAVTGAGLGENARAALITRGLRELSRIVVALGGQRDTAMGLSGLGDLLLSCTGPSSRNFHLGYALGLGETIADALAARAGVVEGMSTAASLVSRAGSTEMPICRAVSSLLDGTITLGEAITQLLSRPQRDE